MGLDFASSFMRIGCNIHQVNLVDEYLAGGSDYLINKIINCIDKNEIDFLLYEFDPICHLSPQEFRRVNKLTFSVVYMGDDEHYFERVGRYYGQAFDMVLTPNFLSHYSYLQYGINAIFFKPYFRKDKLVANERLQQRDIDVSFIGVANGKVGRAEYLNAIASSGICIETFGAGSKNGVITDEELRDVLERSKISLNFTGIGESTFMDGGRTINRRIRSLKGRCQQIALSGAMVISEACPGIELLFEIGNEIKIFNSQTELIDLIRYHLNNNNERERIAKNGYLRASKDYDERFAAKALLDEIISQSKRRNQLLNQIFIDGDFYRVYSSYHLALVFAFIYKKQFRCAINEFILVLKNPRIEIGLCKYYLWSLMPERFRRYIKILYGKVLGFIKK